MKTCNCHKLEDLINTDILKFIGCGGYLYNFTPVILFGDHVNISSIVTIQNCSFQHSVAAVAWLSCKIYKFRFEHYS